jgi:pilus assembly protein CpaB
LNLSQTKAKWWLMVLSIALGCVSAWAIDQHLNEKTQEIESRTRLEQMSLLVAARDLARDTTIEASDFVTEMFPVKWAPDDGISLDQAETVVGKKLLSDVRSGQPLLHIHLKELDPPGISTLLEPELKAVSITVDPSSAASGLIRGGDRVDLFVSLDHQGKRLTIGLLQSVRVLGVGHLSMTNHRTDMTSSSSEAHITLAVSHTDAVKLVAAREAGTISAVLSSPINAEQSLSLRSSTGDLAALLGLPSKPLERIVPIMYGDRLSSVTAHEDDHDASSTVQRTVGAR